MLIGHPNWTGFWRRYQINLVIVDLILCEVSLFCFSPRCLFFILFCNPMSVVWCIAEIAFPPLMATRFESLKSRLFKSHFFLPTRRFYVTIGCCLNVIISWDKGFRKMKNMDEIHPFLYVIAHVTVDSKCAAFLLLLLLTAFSFSGLWGYHGWNLSAGFMDWLAVAIMPRCSVLLLCQYSVPVSKWYVRSYWNHKFIKQKWHISPMRTHISKGFDYKA